MANKNTNSRPPGVERGRRRACQTMVPLTERHRLKGVVISPYICIHIIHTITATVTLKRFHQEAAVELLVNLGKVFSRSVVKPIIASV